MVDSVLLDKIKKGKVILFFGSGALFGATLPNNREILIGNGLRDYLNDKFLDGEFPSSDLKLVSDLAISETSLVEVQNVIKEYFWGVQPADFHSILASFKWRGLFTTNYDLLIETIYQKAENPVQDLVVVTSDKDSIDETRTTNDKVAFVKLHGCITKIEDRELPLILTTSQYNQYKNNRKRLFDLLSELSIENTIVFVGHSLQDPNIVQVIDELMSSQRGMQRHYMLKPGVTDREKRLWESKKITCVPLTFKDFLERINRSIPENDRVLSLVRPMQSHALKRKYNTHSELSPELLRFLTDDVDYLSERPIGTNDFSAKDFFRGVDLKWEAFEKLYPIERSVFKEMLYEICIKEDRVNKTEFYVLKGEAGSGKSIVLRQIAWKGLHLQGVFLWVKEGRSIDVSFLEEISSNIDERIYLFWDNAVLNKEKIYSLVEQASRMNMRLTVITAERYNEWNIECENLDQILTKQFSLKHLNDTEIDLLLGKLAEHNSLGPNLEGKSRREQKQVFQKIYNKQLLVALHEATMGKPFEEIIFDEYQNIVPREAQSLYLTVCSLYRLRIPVRAGLISRIHDLNFESFHEKFFKPLERVVFTRNFADDYQYVARHPEIAEIVFQKVLNSPEIRYVEYVRILSNLNLLYESDLSVFREMVKAKRLLELFHSHEDVVRIYDRAFDFVGREPYLLQQRANYERIRDNGSYDVAISFLEEARAIAPRDYSLLHTLSIVWRDKARSASTEQSNKWLFRQKAKGYIQGNPYYKNNSIFMFTLIELELDTFEDLIKDNSVQSSTLHSDIRKLNEEISQYRKKFPTNNSSYQLEMKLSELIQDDQRVLRVLEESYQKFDADPYTAIALAKIYETNQEIEKAYACLKKAVEMRRGKIELYFCYADLLRRHSLGKPEELMYYYWRSFTPGDTNYEAQFWFARYAFSIGNDEETLKSEEIFETLRRIRFNYAEKHKIRDYENDNENQKKDFTGVVTQKKTGFSFIEVDGSSKKIFYRHDTDSLIKPEVGVRIAFNIGYAYSGISAECIREYL